MNAIGSTISIGRPAMTANQNAAITLEKLRGVSSRPLRKPRTESHFTMKIINFHRSRQCPGSTLIPSADIIVDGKRIDTTDRLMIGGYRALKAAIGESAATPL